MMKTEHMVSVRGKSHEWGVITHIDEQTAQDWRNDGLEVVEVLNSVPVWVAEMGLAQPYMFFQDIFNFRNPFENTPPEER